MACCFGIVTSSSAQEAAADRIAFFEKHVRPILVEHCYECHSEATDRSGGLLLDSKQGWEAGGDSGTAIVPGNGSEGTFLKAIDYKEPKLRMPPDGKLSDARRELLRRWIEEGAFDPRQPTSNPTAKIAQALPVDQAHRHWAYQPLASHCLPDSTQAKSDIDAWIQAKCRERDIEIAPAADRRSQLRRLKFDLLGLPPTPEELEEFLSDTSPDAYERWVDRWLESPHFGERMARHWLDLARFAESYTLRGFVLHQAWRYRDYCVQSFSRDIPWDQFVREQIAGDLMDHQDLEQRRRQQIAVTFLLLGNNNLEEQDKQQLDMDVIDEQLETLGRAFLGQTIGCARCHDHKFDPIPTRDYYALAGILKASTTLKHENVSKWIETPLAMDAATVDHFATLQNEHERLQKEYKRLEKMSADKKSVGQTFDVEKLEGIVVDDEQAKRIGDWEYSSSVKPFVGLGYHHDQGQARGTKTVTFEPSSLPPGRYEVRLSYTHGTNRASNAWVRVFSADGEKDIRIDQRSAGPIDGLWISLGNYRFEKDGQGFVLLTNAEADGHVIADAVQFLPLEAQRIAVKTIPSSNDSPKSSPAPDMKTKLADMKTQMKQFESMLQNQPKAMGLENASKPQDIPIHIRGNVHTLGEMVPRGFLQLAKASMPVSNEDSTSQAPKGPNRLDLAIWLTHPQQALFARVSTNRIWYWFMREGLVDTVDNFGTTGNAPSHPELLDRLASKWMQSGWSSKKLIREIVCSDAYRRSSRMSEHGKQKDPEGRYYGWAKRKRIDAESLRDAMLVASGRIRWEMGGKRFGDSLDNDYGYHHADTCRSLYLPAFRNAMNDLLAAFDMADPSVSIGKRNATTVPQQALVMLNHPLVIDMARSMAKDWKTRLENEPTAWDQLGETMWGRPLHAKEKQMLVEYVNDAASTSASPTGELRIDEARLALMIQSMVGALDFRYLD